MANFNPFSNFGWLGIKQESTAGTAVVPDTYIRITSEAFNANYGNQELNEIATDREGRRNSVQGLIEVTGEFTFFVEPTQVGHFLEALFGAPTSQDVHGDGSAYRHCFTVGDTPLTYTFDIQRGDSPWKQRYFGCQITNMQFNREDNALVCTATVMPRKAFESARVTTEASSGTTLVVDQTSGLTTSDTILVVKNQSNEDGYTTVEEHTISSVDSETQLTVDTISATLEVDDIVMLKTSAVTESSYAQDCVLQFANGTTFEWGNDIDNRQELDIEDFNIQLMNEVEARHGSGGNEIDRFPYDVIVKKFMAEGSFTSLYDMQSFKDRQRKNEPIGVRYFFEGLTAVTANSAQKASSTFGDTANGFKIEASTAGRAGNDINVTIVVNTSDNLAASKSGNNITISLANTTGSKNTGTLIASAVNALSGVDGTAEGTGAEQFTTAADNINLGFKGTGTDVCGADASEKPYLQIDFAAGVIGDYGVNNSENEVIMQEVPFLAFKDQDCDDPDKKNWSVRAFLYNDTASY